MGNRFLPNQPNNAVGMNNPLLNPAQNQFGGSQGGSTSVPPPPPAQPGSSGPGGTLSPGDPHPYVNTPSINNGLIGPPGLPGPEFLQNFLPSILQQPFIDAITAGSTVGSFAGSTLPAAAQFHQGLYSPGLNPMEQGFLGSSAYLGGLGLEQAMNRIEGGYENTPFASSKNKAYMDAGNQFANQMMNTGAQMGLQRMQTAADALGQSYGVPLQAAQAGQEGAGNLLSMAMQAMFGDLQQPMAFYNSVPIAAPTYVQPPAPSGGK